MADAVEHPPRQETAAKRQADKPTDIPREGWVAIFKRVKTALNEHHVSLLAAGVAFKALLALFPSIVAAITIWGLVASPKQIASRLENFTAELPSSVTQLLNSEMQNVAGSDSGALSAALVISLAIALWSASGGMSGLMEGCTAAYNEVDTRKLPVKRGLALLLMFGAIMFLLVAIGLIAILPVVLDDLGLGSVATLVIRIARWPLMAVSVIVGLAVLYKYGPHRDSPHLRWSSWGAVIATILWLIGSALFTLYVNNFGSFGRTYGAFAGIIVLMLWLFLSAYAVLLGAEINAEIEREALSDTT